MNQLDQEAISRISSSQLGPTPQPAPAPEASPAPTPQEQASKQASPMTEGDKAQQAPVTPATEAPSSEVQEELRKIRMKNGQERMLSDSQIANTYENYGNLNHKHSQLQPVISMTEQLMEKTKASPEQVATLMQTALRTMLKNPQMGKQANPNAGEPPKGQPVPKPQAQPAGQNPMGEDIEAAMQKWEDENAIALPPGFKESFGKVGQMEANMQKMMQMMGMVLNSAKHSAQTGMQAAQQGQQSVADARQQSLNNNVNKLQAEFNLADEEATDFMNFAAERGYSPEDYLNYNMLRRVGQDYVNAKNSGELERLRASMDRRSAVMGGPTASPGMGGGSPAPQGGDAAFANLLQAGMKKRGLA